MMGDFSSDYKFLEAKLPEKLSIYSQVCVQGACGTLKCENAAICEKVAKCEKISTLNVKIDAMCEKITLNVKK